MDIKHLIGATTRWVPFALRTVGYGTISVTLGPLTREHTASLWAMRRWCQSSARALGISVECSGLENVPREGAFVYCSNHQSIVDILILGSVLPGDFKWAAKRSVMRLPFIGWHLALAGHIPVDRGRGPQAAARVVERFLETLQKGKPILVFPEGTRTHDGQIKPFKSGSFRAAVQAKVPVIPVALEGTYEMMRRGSFDINNRERQTVYVRIGEPLFPRTRESEEESIRDLRDRTFAAIQKLHAPLRGEAPRPPSAAPTPYPDSQSSV